MYLYDCLTAGECLVACGVPRPVLLGLGGVVGDGLVAAGSADAVTGLCDVVEAAAAEDEDEDEGCDRELAVACAGAWSWRGAVVARDLGLGRVLEEAAGGGEVSCGWEEGRTQSGVQDASVHGEWKCVVESWRIVSCFCSWRIDGQLAASATLKGSGPLTPPHSSRYLESHVKHYRVKYHLTYV
jgi:hypothetical protein